MTAEEQKYAKMLYYSMKMYNNTIEETLNNKDWDFNSIRGILDMRGDIEGKLKNVIDGEEPKKGQIEVNLKTPIPKIDELKIKTASSVNHTRYKIKHPAPLN